MAKNNIESMEKAEVGYKPVVAVSPDPEARFDNSTVTTMASTIAMQRLYVDLLAEYDALMLMTVPKREEELRNFAIETSKQFKHLICSTKWTDDQPLVALTTIVNDMQNSKLGFINTINHLMQLIGETIPCDLQLYKNMENLVSYLICKTYDIYFYNGNSNKEKVEEDPEGFSPCNYVYEKIVLESHRSLCDLTDGAASNFAVVMNTDGKTSNDGNLTGSSDKFKITYLLPCKHIRFRDSNMDMILRTSAVYKTIQKSEGMATFSRVDTYDDANYSEDYVCKHPHRNDCRLNFADKHDCQGCKEEWKINEDHNLVLTVHNMFALEFAPKPNCPDVPWTLINFRINFVCEKLNDYQQKTDADGFLRLYQEIQTIVQCEPDLFLEGYSLIVFFIHCQQLRELHAQLLCGYANHVSIVNYKHCGDLTIKYWETNIAYGGIIKPACFTVTLRPDSNNPFNMPTIQHDPPMPNSLILLKTFSTGQLSVRKFMNICMKERSLHLLIQLKFLILRSVPHESQHIDLVPDFLLLRVPILLPCRGNEKMHILMNPVDGTYTVFLPSLQGCECSFIIAIENILNSQHNFNGILKNIDQLRFWLAYRHSLRALLAIPNLNISKTAILLQPGNHYISTNLETIIVRFEKFENVVLVIHTKLVEDSSYVVYYFFTGFLTETANNVEIMGANFADICGSILSLREFSVVAPTDRTDTKDIPHTKLFLVANLIKDLETEENFKNKIFAEYIYFCIYNNTMKFIGYLEKLMPMVYLTNSLYEIGILLEKTPTLVDADNVGAMHLKLANPIPSTNDFLTCSINEESWNDFTTRVKEFKLSHVENLQRSMIWYGELKFNSPISPSSVVYKNMTINMCYCAMSIDYNAIALQILESWIKMVYLHSLIHCFAPIYNHKTLTQQNFITVKSYLLTDIKFQFIVNPDIICRVYYSIDLQKFDIKFIGNNFINLVYQMFRPFMLTSLNSQRNLLALLQAASFLYLPLAAISLLPVIPYLETERPMPKCEYLVVPIALNIIHLIYKNRICMQFIFNSNQSVTISDMAGKSVTYPTIRPFMPLKGWDLFMDEFSREPLNMEFFRNFKREVLKPMPENKHKRVILEYVVSFRTMHELFTPRIKLNPEETDKSVSLIQCLFFGNDR